MSFLTKLSKKRDDMVSRPYISFGDLIDVEPRPEEWPVIIRGDGHGVARLTLKQAEELNQLLAYALRKAREINATGGSTFNG